MPKKEHHDLADLSPDERRRQKDLRREAGGQSTSVDLEVQDATSSSTSGPKED